MDSGLSEVGTQPGNVEGLPRPPLPGPTFFSTLALYRLAALAFWNVWCSSSTALAWRSSLRVGMSARCQVVLSPLLAELLLESSWGTGCGSGPGGNGLGHRDSDLDSGQPAVAKLWPSLPPGGARGPLFPESRMGLNLGRGCPNKPGGLGFLRFPKEQGWQALPGPHDLGHSPICGAYGLAVTAQSLLQKPQAVLAGLQWGEKSVTQASRLGGGCEEPPTSYLHSEPGDLPARSLFQGTVLIWGEKGWILPLYLLSGVPNPPPARRHPPSTPWK